ncbi:transposase [Desulfobulbus oralis]|uniref:transposase n=1 Tax=Desulfobulbus oralis TaxID=1986146 RepID=UPI0011AFE0EE|nr:transposase [Desulfobulbus oralis]
MDCIDKGKAHRGQIELFFRWIRQRLNVRSFVDTSTSDANAVAVRLVCLSSGGVSQVQKPPGACSIADFATRAAQCARAAGSGGAPLPEQTENTIKNQTIRITPI